MATRGRFDARTAFYTPAMNGNPVIQCYECYKYTDGAFRCMICDALYCASCWLDCMYTKYDDETYMMCMSHIKGRMAAGS